VLWKRQPESSGPQSAENQALLVRFTHFEAGVRIAGSPTTPCRPLSAPVGLFPQPPKSGHSIPPLGCVAPLSIFRRYCRHAVTVAATRRCSRPLPAFRECEGGRYVRVGDPAPPLCVRGSIAGCRRRRPIVESCETEDVAANRLSSPREPAAVGRLPRFT